jgi:N-acyl-D-amino-acid deacylase
MEWQDMKEKIEQGITTSISGQCGTSVAPKTIAPEKDRYIPDVGLLSEATKDFAAFKNAVKNLPLGSNNVCLIGHGTLRVHVMGMKKDEPNAEEMERMKAFVRNAMENNAIGISFGLIYPPSSYAKTEELIELAKVVEEQKKTVDNVVNIIRENNTLKKFVAEMYAEAVGKITAANKIIGNTLTDAGDMAHTIAMMQAQKQGSNVGTMPI